MSSLKDRVALIAGGAGEVGEGIVKAFLQAGATVVVPSRKPERLMDLQIGLGELGNERFVAVTADVGTPEGAHAVRQTILQRFGQLNAVVASLGGWWQGKPLVSVPLEDWANVLQNNLTAHLLVARTFLPMLYNQPGSSYTMINGGAAFEPVPGAGPVSIAAAAQLMMKDVLAAEARGRPVRVNTLALMTPVVTRSRPSGRPEWLTADEVGAYCAYLAAAVTNGETIQLKDHAQVEAIQAQ